MRFRASLVLLMLFYVALTAKGQTPAAGEMDPAKEADIRRLIQLTGQGFRSGDFIRQILAQMHTMTASMQKERTPEERERFNRFMERFEERMIPRMEKEMAQIYEDMVPIYAKHFTHEEIKATLQFYESPTGKKWLAKMPELMQDSMSASMPRMQQMNKELMDEMMADLRKEFPELGAIEPEAVSQEARAVGSLRTLNTALVTYSATYGGFAKTLAALGPGNPVSETAADLIDESLAGGTKNGYVFTYTPGAPDRNGRIVMYTITADPLDGGVRGQRFFFTDESGVIRFSRTGRATADSPPLS